MDGQPVGSRRESEARFGGTRYRLLDEIGRGAMGVVYRALDTELRRIVALKLLADEWAGDAAEAARFREEARALAALAHPGIVRLLDAGTAGGQPYLAMELVAGSDLFTVARMRGRLPVEEVAGWMAQAADALCYLHQRRFLHRDVKPSNLIADALGRVTLMDFGLVRSRDATGLTAPGVVVGTLRYLAPEVLTGGASTPERDVYALAITCYELLAGRPWCAEKEEAALVRRILDGASLELKGVRPEVPGWLEGVLRSATRPEAHARPSAAHFRDLLRAGGALAPEVTARIPWQRSWRDRYRVVEKIGSGAMGVVYRAEQQGLAREVALKTILPQLDVTADLAERFRREALALSRVSHPNLVKVLDVSVPGEEPYLAMELVRGRTLEAEVLAKPADARRAGDTLFLGILEAVAALHENGLIHRDLKPSNVMVSDEGRPVVMDLGLVKDAGGRSAALTASAALIGTPAYLPPETLYGTPATFRADVWALGAIYFFLHAGVPAFRRATLQALLEAIAHDPLPDLEVHCAGLSPERRHFLLGLLERDPESRPRDARIVLQSFRSVLSGGAAPRPTAPGRGQSRGRGAHAALTVVLGALLIGLCSIAARPWRETPARVAHGPAGWELRWDTGAAGRGSVEVAEDPEGPWKLIATESVATTAHRATFERWPSPGRSLHFRVRLDANPPGAVRPLEVPGDHHPLDVAVLVEPLRAQLTWHTRGVVAGVVSVSNSALATHERVPCQTHRLELGPLTPGVSHALSLATPDGRRLWGRDVRSPSVAQVSGEVCEILETVVRAPWLIPFRNEILGARRRDAIQSWVSRCREELRRRDFAGAVARFETVRDRIAEPGSLDPVQRARLLVAVERLRDLERAFASVLGHGAGLDHPGLSCAGLRVEAGPPRDARPLLAIRFGDGGRAGGREPLSAAWHPVQVAHPDPLFGTAVQLVTSRAGAEASPFWEVHIPGPLCKAPLPDRAYLSYRLLGGRSWDRLVVTIGPATRARPGSPELFVVASLRSAGARSLGEGTIRIDERALADPRAELGIYYENGADRRGAEDAIVIDHLVLLGAP